MKVESSLVVVHAQKITCYTCSKIFLGTIWRKILNVYSKIKGMQMDCQNYSFTAPLGLESGPLAEALTLSSQQRQKGTRNYC